MSGINGMLWVLTNPETGRLLAGGHRFGSKEEASHYGHTRCPGNWEAVTWPAYCKKHPSRR